MATPVLPGPVTRVKARRPELGTEEGGNARGGGGQGSGVMEGGVMVGRAPETPTGLAAGAKRTFPFSFVRMLLTAARKVRLQPVTLGYVYLLQKDCPVRLVHASLPSPVPTAPCVHTAVSGLTPPCWGVGPLLLQLGVGPL